MKDDTAGFTLVELLVTITVFGIAVAGISSIFISIQRIQHRAAYADYATRAAQREIEVLRNDNYGALTPGQTIDFTSDLPSNLPSQRSGTVTVSQPSADLRRVDVTVRYTVSGKESTVTLSSLIGVIGITQ